MTSAKPPDGVVRLRPARPCPVCGKPSQRETYPFCSRRCAEIDLHRWLAGTYAIPADEDEEKEGEERGDAED